MLPGGGLGFVATDDPGLMACGEGEASIMGLSSELGEILLLIRGPVGASGRNEVSPACRLTS